MAELSRRARFDEAVESQAEVAAALDASVKPMLRFLTCGSVDDGKSTLIGRLLYDCQLIFEDALSAVERDSKTYGTTGEAIDFALLVDGLQAEREQGITIDVAYRYFSTPRRKFIVADTPGHEQYTRNMVTGASNCDLAVILVDARKGVQVQTRRHTCIVQLLGIKQVVLAINKMDAVGYDEAVFTAIDDEYRAFAMKLGLAHVRSIPVSALREKTSPPLRPACLGIAAPPCSSTLRPSTVRALWSPKRSACRFSGCAAPIPRSVVMRATSLLERWPPATQS